VDDLPRHWSDVDEITDLAEATQVEIDTCGIILPTVIAKIKKPQNAPLQPRLPKARTPTLAPGFEPRDRGWEPKERADDSRHSPFPTTFCNMHNS